MPGRALYAQCITEGGLALEPPPADGAPRSYLTYVPCATYCSMETGKSTSHKGEGCATRNLLKTCNRLRRARLLLGLPADAKGLLVLGSDCTSPTTIAAQALA